MSDAMDTKTAQEYWVSSDELLLAGAKALDDGQQQQGIDLLSKAFEQRSFAAILFQVERDTLAAELVALRAGLPRWRRMTGLKRGSPKAYWLGVKSDRLGLPHAQAVLWQNNEDKSLYGCGEPKTEPMPLAAAMLAVTEALGLPPCEVEGE